MERQGKKSLKSGGFKNGFKKHAGLSLEKFARAKKSTYDPRQAKEKERARAAITIAKYKKLKNKLHKRSDGPLKQQLGGGDIVTIEEAARLNNKTSDASNVNESIRNQKTKDKEMQNKQNSKAKVNQADINAEEERQEALEKAAQKEAAAKRRREQNKLFKKKTAHGQPVMKHRIERMLDALEKSS